MSISIYECKDGRMRVYIKESQKVMSYPKYLMEQELGRQLLPNEEIHHRDEDPLNNAIGNLQVRIHGEHQAEHATKYHDTVTTCRWCGTEFLWTAKQQRTFYNNRRYENGLSMLPFCSRSCAGKYGRQKQLDNGDGFRSLTEEQVKFIREHHNPHDKYYGSRPLAARFNVNKTSIDLIVKGKTYKDIV